MELRVRRQPYRIPDLPAECQRCRFDAGCWLEAEQLLLLLHAPMWWSAYNVIFPLRTEPLALGK
jgi:hypothetical protein